MCNEGIITITSIIIPIPPIQWVKLLQNKIDLGSISISVKIEAPVVVKPETDSKIALVKPGIEFEIMYGNEPIKEKKIHENVTIRLASFLVNDSTSFPLFLNKYREKPNEAAIIPDNMKGLTGSENKIATIELANNAPAKMNKLLPMIGKFIPGLSILSIYFFNCGRKIDAYFI